MTDRTERYGLQVATVLADFIDDRALPGTGVDADAFWQGFSALLHHQRARNRELLLEREALQAKIDAWHLARRGGPFDRDGYEAFLHDIGYLVPEGEDFTIETANIDPEIAHVPGPQLVVPITNARFALNAANARWGSLYDAFYGTDAMGVTPPTGKYDRGHGGRVVARTRVFLDSAFPIAGGSHADVKRYTVEAGALLADGMPLDSPGKFVGHRGDPASPDTVLLVNHGLHVELVFDDEHPIGKRDQASLADVRLESAITVIMDCEDSVACVDAEDKVLAYDNWLGLMQGDLSASVSKGGQAFTPPSERGLDLRRRRRLGHRPQGEGAALDPQRGAPDDQSRDPDPRRRRGVRRPDGRHDHLADRGARSSARRRQLGTRLRLHREAEAARPGRGGLHR